MFTVKELALLLDAVMVLYTAVKEAPVNDGSNLPEIDALQHKIERLLSGLVAETQSVRPATPAQRPRS